MAYDELLAQRIKKLVGDEPGLTEKKMFGGIAYMVSGNMACGVVRDELMVRVGPEGYNDALARPHARLMDFTGRPMTGMVMVGREGIKSEMGLEEWVGLGVLYAASLPPKVK